MYAFVLEWTPALTTPSTRPPYGLIFSCFMVAYMAGSTTFALFLRNGVRPATALVIFMASSVFAIGGGCGGCLGSAPEWRSSHQSCLGSAAAWRLHAAQQ